MFREKDWATNPDCVYVGMPGYAGQDTGYFGKPWKITRDSRGWRIAYVEYVSKRIQEDPVFAGAVAALHGKVLICFCKGKGGIEDRWCHGDVLAFWSELLWHEMEGDS